MAVRRRTKFAVSETKANKKALRHRRNPRPVLPESGKGGAPAPRRYRLPRKSGRPGPDPSNAGWFAPSGDDVTSPSGPGRGLPGGAPPPGYWIARTVGQWPIHRE